MKEIKENIIELLKDRAEKKVSDVVFSEKYKKLMRSLREILLKYLQKISKRSRSHFAKILDNLIGVLKGIESTVMIVGSIVLTPRQIAPDMCGLVQIVREEQQRAFSRVFSEPNSSLP